MDWKKRIVRYAKRVIYPIVSGGIAFFLVKGINFILSKLEPGWLIVFLMPIAQVALPLAAAFITLCRRIYTEAEEDGELEEILKNTPPLFSRRERGSISADNETPGLCQEDTISEEVCSEAEPYEYCTPEKEPQEPVAPMDVQAESGIEQEHFSEPALSTEHAEEQPQSEQEAPPTLTEQPVQHEAEINQAETFDTPAAPETIPDPCDAAVNAEDDPPNEQELDIFDHIRNPEVMAHYIVLDIETTGLSREKDRIIEIAAIHYVFGEEASRFHTYINPQVQIPKYITKLTGICQDDIAEAPLLEDIADDFRDFIKDYPLVGHNIIEFDWPFLSSHMEIGDARFLIDTLDMSRRTFPMLCSHKLSDLNYWFRLDNGAAHRADADAAATNALMWACLYPDKYAPLYRKAIRNGPSPNKQNTYSHAHPDHISISEIVPQTSCAIASGPLLGKRIVFTGELNIPRKDAMQMAVNAGALLRTSVSCKTDILVVGRQDMSVVGPDGMSGKEEKAQKINASGKGHIKIIEEDDFMSMVSNVSKLDTK